MAKLRQMDHLFKKLRGKPMAPLKKTTISKRLQHKQSCLPRKEKKLWCREVPLLKTHKRSFMMMRVKTKLIRRKYGLY